jgi:transposase
VQAWPRPCHSPLNEASYQTPPSLSSGVLSCDLHVSGNRNYLVAHFQRILRRRGKYKAVIALAHTVLVIIYCVLRDNRPHTDLGVDYFDRLKAARIERYHVRRLEQLGYSVTLAAAGT